MNILILTHSYPDINNKWRGVFIQEQAKALCLANDITVVYFKVDYTHFAPFSKYSFHKKTEGKITVFEVTVNKSFPVITQLKYLSDTYRFIRKEILNQKRIDIIHSHLSYPAGFLGTIIQKRKNIPNVVTEHSWITRYFRSRIHKMCVLYTFKNSYCIIAVSKALREDIIKYVNHEVKIVPNVVDVEKFRIPETRKREILNIGLLGGMGNFRKGLDILLKSVSLLKNTDLLVHIGGDGIYLETFKKMSVELGIREKCKFYGEILPSEINNFYSGLDIYVLASRDETFGVVIVEAMSCGLPVIATRCGGPEEIITHETGVLVEKENPDELARAIVSVSDNLGSYDRDLIRRYALEKYGREAFVAEITRIYQEVISASTTAR